MPNKSRFEQIFPADTRRKAFETPKTIRLNQVFELAASRVNPVSDEFIDIILGLDGKQIMAGRENVSSIKDYLDLLDQTEKDAEVVADLERIAELY